VPRKQRLIESGRELLCSETTASLHVPAQPRGAADGTSLIPEGTSSLKPVTLVHPREEARLCADLAELEATRGAPRGRTVEPIGDHAMT
jgi:hypothetical protein